ncbi:MAG TPA: transporter, partial [Aquabacterium sp.]|nr:transporter [Aquabacterium sp.]
GAVAAALATSAQAAENRAQRYTAGLGGSDLTSMLVPGWYGQVAMIHYHATKLKGNDGKDVSTVAGGVVPAASLAGLAAQAVVTNTSNNALLAPTATNVGTALAGTGLAYTSRLSNFRADAYVMLPRITYLSTQKFLGAHLGFTAMLPLIERQTALSGVTSFANSSAVQSAISTGVLNTTGSAPLAAGVSQGVVSGVQSNVNTQAAATLAGRSGSNAGFGDLEMAPILNWEIGDHQTVTVTPTVIFPTGEYDKDLAVNPGFGKFYTFRPSVQYGFIGDGWDVGARAVLSFNSRNTETDYRSGNMFNLDFALMKFVTEDLRLGLQGYVVQQFSKDTSDNATEQAAIDAEGGRKMRVYGLGPALAWVVNGGEMMVEGKVIKEFNARNRAEGATYMLTVSKPFGL